MDNTDFNKKNYSPREFKNKIRTLYQFLNHSNCLEYNFFINGSMLPSVHGGASLKGHASLSFCWLKTMRGLVTLIWSHDFMKILGQYSIVHIYNKVNLVHMVYQGLHCAVYSSRVWREIFSYPAQAAGLYIYSFEQYALSHFLRVSWEYLACLLVV